MKQKLRLAWPNRKGDSRSLVVSATSPRHIRTNDSKGANSRCRPGKGRLFVKPTAHCVLRCCECGSCIHGTPGVRLAIDDAARLLRSASVRPSPRSCIYPPDADCRKARRIRAVRRLRSRVRVDPDSDRSSPSGLTVTGGLSRALGAVTIRKRFAGSLYCHERPGYPQHGNGLN